MAQDGERNSEGKQSHEEDGAKQMVPFYKLFSFADSLDILLMALGTLGAIGNGLALPFMTLILGQITNAFGTNFGNVNKLLDAVSKVAIRFVYLGAAASVVSFCQVAFWIWTGERQASRIRALYLEATLRQDITFFDTETNTGEVIERMSGDTVLIQDAIGEKVGKFIQLVSTFIGGFALALVRGWKLTLVMMATLPLMVACGASLAFFVSRMAGRGQAAYAKAGAIAEQVISGIRTVASFTGEAKAVAEYNNALKAAYDAGKYQGLASGLGLGGALCTFFCSYALALWYGSRLIIKEGYSGGEVLNVIIVVLLGALSLGQASPCVSAFAAGKAAAYKMFQVIHRQPKIDSFDTSGLVLENVRGDIQFDNVDFSYPARPEVRIFKGFNLSIPAGSTVALVGESGSGKSTVVSLIERFYDPLSGRVLLDDHDIRELQVQWLRKQIGLVSQEPVLFGTTIRENIAYGKEGATNEEIMLAAQLANAAKFIAKMTEGYDTQVGEHGTQLSGGQKQRIAIARAILKNPRILLLDEATSALDAESEHVVQEALDRIMVDRTTVVVAHRLSTVRNAGVIAVVQNGSIVEKGTHLELLENPDGAYSQLIRLQEVHQDVSKPKEDADEILTNERSLTRSISKSSSGRWSGRWSFGSRKGRSPSLARTLSTKDAPYETIQPAKPKSRLFCFKSRDIEGEDSTQVKDVSVFRVASLNKPEWPILLFGSIAAVCHGMIFPTYSLLLSSMLSTFFLPDHHKLRKDANFWALMFVVIGAASFIVCPTNIFSFAVAGSKLVTRIRQLTFSNVVRQEMAWFDESGNSSGAISARLSNDAANVRGMVGDSLSLVVQNAATIIAGLVYAFTADWRLAFLILAMVPLLSIVGFLQVKLMTGFGSDAKLMYQEASSIATSAVGSIRTVASFGAERRILKQYKEASIKPLNNAVRIGFVSAAGLAVSTIVQFGCQALIFWYGARLVRDGKTTFKSVFRVFFAIIFTALAVAQTMGLAPDLSKVKSSVISIFATIDKKSKIDPADTDGTTLEVLRGNIEFHHVSFKYPTRPNVPIFHNLSFTVRAGKTLALVGESGCGKSTVIYLLERFYDPDAGTIVVDGHDIRKLQLRWYRQQVGLVSQEPILFTGSIRSNIVYGKDGPVSDQEVVRAAQAANAHEFITSLPEGYDTEVGERGIQLSGGQKQRIAIARAIIKDPKILLLDEATSALDAESEHVVQAALDRLMVDRTTVIVAHRLTTIVNSDMIAVVKNGGIVEKGSHSQLMQIEDGAYASLVKLHTASA